jgi:hypothetical protein
MSQDSYNQFLELQHIMVALPLANHDSKDVWHFIWGQYNIFQENIITITSRIYIQTE